MKALEIKNLTIDYGKGAVLRDFSLEVAAGCAMQIQGPSGCGKSTLLHAICGLIPSPIQAEISGEILLFGRPVGQLSVAERAQKIGIVFQNPETQLFCDTVEDEIAFGLENICMPVEQMGARIAEMLALVGLEEFRHSSPKELSGGQKQRLVLAAVLALDPQILLLDEALSQLDEGGKMAMLRHLEALAGQGKTILAVDHDELGGKLWEKILEIS
ncbi:MAG: energy-coupling factor ABC transporter ATP-binding protein [Clostridiales bacterium]|jgi:energy-coupling factor transport system ATP-binding protein|nr:energy-coupling factor ABC transporter ATP-binding protein [Clostridiales bacterium]